MADIIEKLDGLPYPEWYDSDGRIYKDILIKNFNALEDKINEVIRFDYSSISAPIISNLEYPDVSLSDVDKDNQILNFKSFLEICNIVNFPLSVKTSGVKVLTVEIWDENYNHRFINATGDNGTATTTYPFIHLNTSTKEIVRSNEVSPSNCILLAVLYDSKLVTNNEATPANVNFLKVLADQNFNMIDFTFWIKGQYLNTYKGQAIADGYGQNGHNSKTGAEGDILYGKTAGYFLDSLQRKGG